MSKVLKKDYREQIRLAKMVIKGLEVVIEEGEYQNLPDALRACETLKVLADNIAWYAKKMGE
jgi:hypothetical protein